MFSVPPYCGLSACATAAAEPNAQQRADSAIVRTIGRWFAEGVLIVVSWIGSDADRLDLRGGGFTGAAHARIEQVAQRVAEDVGGVHHEGQAQAGCQRQPGPLEHVGAAAARQQAAPGRAPAAARPGRGTTAPTRPGSRCRRASSSSTMIGGITLGSTWRHRMRGEPAPIDCAACTYMCSRTDDHGRAHDARAADAQQQRPACR